MIKEHWAWLFQGRPAFCPHMNFCCRIASGYGIRNARAEHVKYLARSVQIKRLVTMPDGQTCGWKHWPLDSQLVLYHLRG